MKDCLIEIPTVRDENRKGSIPSRFFPDMDYYNTVNIEFPCFTDKKSKYFLFTDFVI